MPAIKSFNPATDVNTANDTITINDHGFSALDGVIYSNGTNQSVGGLVSGTKYYVIVIDNNNIKLGADEVSARNSIAVDLISTGSGTVHTLEFTTIYPKETAVHNIFQQVRLTGGNIADPDGETLSAETVNDTLNIIGGAGVSFTSISNDSKSFTLNSTQYDFEVPVGTTNLRLFSDSGDDQSIILTPTRGIAITRVGSQEIEFESFGVTETDTLQSISERGNITNNKLIMDNLMVAKIESTPGVDGVVNYTSTGTTGTAIALTGNGTLDNELLFSPDYATSTEAGKDVYVNFQSPAAQGTLSYTAVYTSESTLTTGSVILQRNDGGGWVTIDNVSGTVVDQSYEINGNYAEIDPATIDYRIVFSWTGSTDIVTYRIRVTYEVENVPGTEIILTDTDTEVLTLGTVGGTVIIRGAVSLFDDISTDGLRIFNNNIEAINSDDNIVLQPSGVGGIELRTETMYNTETTFNMFPDTVTELNIGWRDYPGDSTVPGANFNNTNVRTNLHVDGYLDIKNNGNEIAEITTSTMETAHVFTGVNSITIGNSTADINLGNIDINGNDIDSNDSSAINIVAPLTTSSDITVGNDLFVPHESWLHRVFIDNELRLNTDNVHLGNGSGEQSQGQYAIAVGYYAGQNFQGNASIAIGNVAGKENQGINGIAIGLQAGQDSQGLRAIAIGTEAGDSIQGDDAVSIGYSAGSSNQGSNSIAIGAQAGSTNQDSSAVAIGISAGATSQGLSAVALGRNAGQISQSNNGIAIGNYAGNDRQSSGIAIGASAGQTLQGGSTIAIGSSAGQTSQGLRAIAIGLNAGNSGQNSEAISIGREAGQTDQNANAIAIGYIAGNDNQGAYGIAIGQGAGEVDQGINAIAIGEKAGYQNQAANSIIINATGVDLTNSNTDSFVVKPVRNAVTDRLMFYNTTSGEISYGSDIALTFSGSTISTDDSSGVVIAQELTVQSSLDVDTDLVVGQNITAGGNVLVTGDLTVQGATTTLNTQTLDVEDINITVAKGATNSLEADGAGITVDGAGTSFTYDAAEDKWSLDKGLIVTGAGSFTGTLTSLSTATFSSLESTPIGETTRSSGKFTTLDANSTVTLSPANVNVTLSPSGTGGVIINPVGPSSIDNVVIGGTTAVAGTFTDLASTGWLTTAGVTEQIDTKTAATGTINHDLDVATVFYHSSISGDFVANFTNVPTTNNRTVSVAVVLEQGGIGRDITGVEVNGSSVTVKWLGGITHTGTANEVEILSFTIVRVNSAYQVLGSISTFG